MKREYRALLILVCVGALWPATFSFGQEKDTRDLIELLRSDVKAQKNEITTNAMQFTEKEAEVFWPIYRQYEYESSKNGDARIELIKEFANNYAALTNEKAGELAKKWFDLQEKRNSLLKKYYGKLSDAITAKRAARWVQIEHQLDLLIDTQVAESLPLIK